MAKLYIICGHGAGDPGAIGNGYKEAERVRALGKRMAALGGAEVELLDTSRNWYADGGLNGLKIPAGACVLELHMDSAGSGARGGHVIISAKRNADKRDLALAAFISGYFPGRSAIIVKRSDLANANRAAARGINYRLLEVCFITNAQDMAKFNANMDAVARGILAAFGISEPGETEAEKAARIEKERVKGLPASLKGYKDLWPGKWYLEGIRKAVEGGLMGGVSTERFAPDDPITRIQAIVIVYHMEGKAQYKLPYSDVAQAPWYFDAARWATENGIVSGSGGKLRPGDACTRQDIAVILWRCAGKPEPGGQPEGFSDWGSVSDYARDGVAWCVNNGIISGSNGRIMPNDVCTRAQAATIVTKL